MRLYSRWHLFAGDYTSIKSTKIKCTPIIFPFSCKMSSSGNCKSTKEHCWGWDQLWWHKHKHKDTKRYKLWSCQNVCEALIYLLDNIYIRFGTKLYRQIVGIPMGTNCAPLVADLFLFCYERDFMTSLSDVKQAEIIEAFKSTSRYLDDLLNIDNPYFEGMVNRI